MLRRAILPEVLLLSLVPAGCVSRIAPPSTPAAGRLEAYLVAHPDDWQLFMGDVALRGIRDGTRTVFIYTTAGDAGRPSPYWLARERGALASVGFALGASPPDTLDAVVSGGPSPRCADTLVDGRTVWRCRFGATASYFLRLPDGNLNGEGFTSTGGHSLSQLEGGVIRALAPLQGEGPYPTWKDLAAVVTAVLQAESAGRNPSGNHVRIHATDPDTSFNPIDHSDHRATGRLAAMIAKEEGWELSQYAGYSTMNWPTNLSAEQFASKAALFMAYDRAMVLADPAWSSYAEEPREYSPWLSRTYLRPQDFSVRPP